MDWLELTKYVIPALTALLGTGITLFFQYKSKKIELVMQNEFKAREHLFAARKAKVEEIIEIINNYHTMMTNFGKKLILSKNDEQKRAIIKLFVKSVGIVFSIDDGILQNIKHELEAHSDYRKLDDRFQFAIQYFKSDFNSTPVDELEKSFFQVMYFMQNIINFIRDHEEKEMLKIFDKYVSI